MKVLIVGGGISDEREISLQSSRAVYEAAIAKGYAVDLYDWDGTENWLLDHVADFDVVLPIQHGAGAEDGVLQRILEKTGVPFLGSDSKASELCFNKQKSREKYKDLGADIADGRLLTLDEYQQSKLAQRPHVLKPNQDGSSIGVIIVKDPQDAPEEDILKAFNERKTLLVEEFLDGVEITVPILEGKELPIIKIIPPEDGFNYENKYNGSTKEIVDPIDIKTDVKRQALSLGKKVHISLGCRHLSRTDMMICGDRIYMIETNTLPGMTAQSLFPKAAAAAGLDFPDLVDYFIKLARK